MKQGRKGNANGEAWMRGVVLGRVRDMLERLPCAVTSLMGTCREPALAWAGAMKSFRGEKSRRENHPRRRDVAAPADHAQPWDLLLVCGYELGVDTSLSRTLPLH